VLRKASTLLFLAASVFTASQELTWAPKPPGKARGVASAAELSIENDALKLGFANGHLTATNKWTSASLDLGTAAFRIVMRSGKSYDIVPSKLRRGQFLSVDRLSPRLTEQRPGLTAITPFKIPELKLDGYWRLTLRDGSDYARIEVGLHPLSAPVDVREIDILNFKAPGSQVVGKTQGSPITTGDFFFGTEHPMSFASVADDIATTGMKRTLPIRPGGIVTYSAVVGVYPKGQLRRAFLSYVESERAHYYRPFLHYNSWYDIGYGNTFNEKDCLDRISKFGTELVEKRGVKMDSFLFDDGWDDLNSVWKFHSGFPHEFLPLKEAAEKYGAAPGVWLSPWGGYSSARTKRLAYGKSQGMEIDSQGYALSGPKYYRRFHDVTMDFVTRQGINQFKFDGTGSPDKTTPGSAFDSDFDAAIALIGDLRQARPDLFVNLTTGTWPSPFWLRYADSTWRGGADHSFAGVGSSRQQWMTYRDGDTYHGVVQRGPLYPINSLMVHGILYATHANRLNTDPNNDFKDEVHTYFGNGTQLQEMYITPDLMTSNNWDELAEAAKWSRANADVLVDTHWVGGDPTKLDVYGWASWSPRKAVLVLRNPSDKPQAFSVDIASVLEIPVGSTAKSYAGTSPWKAEADLPAMTFPVGSSLVVDLKPFEVRVWDLEAKK
jgi:hypothetical protein